MSDAGGGGADSVVQRREGGGDGPASPRFVIRKLQSAAEVTDRVGEIIEQTAPDVYHFIYGDVPASKLTALARADGNCFSWHNLWAAYETDARTGALGDVVGVVVAYEPSKVEMNGYFGTLVAHFGVLRAVQYALRYSLLYALPGGDTRLACEDAAERTFLVQEVAVDARVRGRRIATRLLNAVEQHARRCCRRTAPAPRYCLTLEVAEENRTARRLYEHLGFRAADRAPRYHTPFPCLPGAVRWSRMVKDCTDPPFADPDCLDPAD